MKKKRKVVNKVLDSYEIPSKEILRHRNEFFGLWRRSDDQMTAWLKRVQNCIRRCEFLSSISELLVIDRFVCGLNEKELNSFKTAKKSWTLELLSEHFAENDNEAASIVIENAHQFENISLEIVKLEPNKECFEKDPFSESAERTGSFGDVTTNIDGIEEEMEESIEESTNFQGALNEEIDHEMLNTGMEFECEEYKFSLKNVAATVTSVTTEAVVINGASSAAAITTDIDLTAGDVDTKRLNSSTENDQQKHHSDVDEAATNASMAIECASPSPSLSISTSTASMDSTTDDFDENLTNSSVEEEPNRKKRFEKSSTTNPPIKLKQKTPKEKKRHTCEQCNRSFDRPFKLKLHVKDVHEGIRDHACDLCDKRYARIYDLQVHARSHTGERPYVCDQCGVSYAHSNILAKHKKTIHEGLRPHVCQICDKRFTMKSKLIQHLIVHTGGEKSFACDLCDKKFNRQTILKTHKDRFHRQKIYSHLCPICDKRFFNTTELKKHSFTHTGERPHKCDQCEKSFSRSSAMMLHKNAVHQGIRPYACPHCDKRFKRIVHLKQHLTIHTGVKPYKCDICNKSFALGHHLSSHRKSVHQLKA